MNIEFVRGSCLCGDVRFRAKLPSKWCAHCHCSMCRKAHGAGYVTWVGFPAERFEVTQGANQLRWYTSSKQGERGFCDRCGSTLLFRSERWADEMHIALGAMDEPIDRLPQANVYHDHHVDWVAIDESLTVRNYDD